MKRIILFILQSCLFLVFTGNGQKLNIDRDFPGDWALASVDGVSPNGQYVCYTIPNNHNGVFVSSVSGAWKMELSGISDLKFLNNNKHLLFKRRTDSLFSLKLGTARIDFVAQCKSDQLVSIGGVEWLVYETGNANKEIVLRSMSTGKESHYLHVIDYKFSPLGNTLVLKTEAEPGSEVIHLEWVKLPREKTTAIWEGKTVSDYTFDQTGTKLTFVAKEGSGDDASNAVWYYSDEMSHAVSMVTQQNIGIEKGLIISEAAPEFNGDGNLIFFHLQKIAQEVKAPVADGVQVDIWSYSDHRLQSEQTDELLGSRQPVKTFMALGNIKSKKVLRIQHDGEHILQRGSEQHGGFILLASDNDGGSWWIDPHFKPSFYLVSVDDCSRKLLFKGGYYMGASPNGKYIVWFDSEKDALYCYNVGDGSTKNMSSSIRVSFKDQDWDTPGNARPRVGRLAWFKNDMAFLVQDDYDIWQIDPSGKKAPVNITSGYGRAHHIRFALADINYQANDLGMKDKLLLTAFDRLTKYSGFFSKQLGNAGDPELLTMGPFKYRIMESIGTLPVVKEGQNWILTRMSDVEAPDYFWTKDFKKFNPITDNQPQRGYNWLKAELLNYKLQDGVASQAILYKPENFDSTKKYPVLFNYYEKKSDDLYKYLAPEQTYQDINIPYFVSHGYLVVLPDMYYKVGSAGDGAVQSIIGAVNCIAKFPFVDTSRMGIDGMSWGGYETNYIITHAHLFAAAAEMAGPSDLVSQVNDISLDGHSLYMQSLWQMRVGQPFGEDPERYIKNSPIFNVNNVTTPLLMVHNKEDVGVPWKQGVEFYMALRNCEKRVWMLQYDKGGHSIGTGSKDAQDYTIRLTQFYDHYLKGAPAPVWMTEGIPARLKGIETGYELDPTDSCGKDCKVCKKWNEAASLGKIQKIGNDYEIRSE